MTCNTCNSTRQQELVPVINVPPGLSVIDYIYGFPHKSQMIAPNAVDCKNCGRVPHTKIEELCTRESSAVVMCFNRGVIVEDTTEIVDSQMRFDIPQFLQLKVKDGSRIDTHRIVGVTLHTSGHFVALRRYNDTELKDVACMKIQKTFLNIIKKYILHQTIEELNNFENQTFVHMLQDIGIKKEEYLMALRGSVKISFQFLPKRECRDVFINNYNPQLLQDDPSNHDIQIIAGEEGAYTVGTYIAKYISME